MLPASSDNSDFGQIAGVGASAVVLFVFWSNVAPQALPAGSNARDPGNPDYNWAAVDNAVTAAAAHGLDVLGVITDAPAWALRPANPGATATLPDPDSFADFGAAAAARYSGSFGGLPSVRSWEAWNEPNISLGLKPQYVDGQSVTPDWYRQMLNGFYDAVKSVAPSDVVIGGGLAPFFDNDPATMTVDPDWGPLSFTRRLLCLSDTLQPTCSTPTKFDAWAIHPYTEGSPSHRAALPNDVSLPDVPKMRAVLEAARAAGHIVSSGPVELWAPEFSWDSKPPAEGHVAQSVLMRWVPQALYSMWRSGVSFAAWLTMRDIPWIPPRHRSGARRRHAEGAFACVRIPARRHESPQRARGLGQDAGRPAGRRHDRALHRGRRLGLRFSGRCRATRTASPGEVLAEGCAGREPSARSPPRSGSSHRSFRSVPTRT